MRVFVLAVVAAGCSAQGIANQPEPQCVWHFIAPAVTADSDVQPGVSRCDAASLELHDATLNLSAANDGAVTVGDCHARGTVINSATNSWFVDVDACGVRGMVGANQH